MIRSAVESFRLVGMEWNGEATGEREPLKTKTWVTNIDGDVVERRLRRELRPLSLLFRFCLLSHFAVTCVAHHGNNSCRTSRSATQLLALAVTLFVVAAEPTTASVGVLRLCRC
jgi:hypothetical protein